MRRADAKWLRVEVEVLVDEGALLYPSDSPPTVEEVVMDSVRNALAGLAMWDDRDDTMEPIPPTFVAYDVVKAEVLW